MPTQSLAYATADLFIEVDAARRIVFALGAHDADVTGRSLADLVSTVDHQKLNSLLENLRLGEQRGPEALTLVMPSGATRVAELSVFAPPNLEPNISCALTYANSPGLFAAGSTLDPSAFRFLTRDLLKLAASNSEDLLLALVEIEGVIAAQRNLSGADTAALRAQIQALLARHGVDGAATGLTEERFAIIQEEPDDLDGLLEAVGELSDSLGLNLIATGQSVGLSPERDPLHQFRAVCATLESFLDAGLSRDETDLRRSFLAVLDQTTESAERLDAIIRERRFDLYFQPIVNLGTEAVVSHEVLIRLEKFVGPALMINLAEELDMIERLDALVAEQAVRRLCAPGGETLKLAINISGETLLSDAFLARLLSATDSSPELCSRLQLEITESALLRDLEAASRRIRALRDAEFEVAIDDFGASATSFDYLRALPVSAVKLDGRYVRGVHRDNRAQAAVKEFVGLCNELKLLTVAEMIEREEELATVTALGVACGQGWLFSRPVPEPPRLIRTAAARARRSASPDTRPPESGGRGLVGVRSREGDLRRVRFRP